MSATILDKKMFSKWLGLKPEEVYYLSIPTPFDSKKRPIELDFAGKMNRIGYGKHYLKHYQL